MVIILYQIVEGCLSEMELAYMLEIAQPSFFNYIDDVTIYE